jgi:hypothetical protein
MTARRTLVAWTAGVALAAAFPADGADLPTADEVFARHHAAIGGDAIDKVRNAAFEFSFTMPSMGLVTTGKAYQVFPGKAYMMIDLASVGATNHEEGVLDGVAWQNSPQTGLRTLDGWRSEWRYRERGSTPSAVGRSCGRKRRPWPRSRSPESPATRSS